jgi:LacI family transcriptional regulator
MDTVGTMSALVRHVISYGHEHIALITGPGGISHNEHIKEGLQLALDEAQLSRENCRIIESTDNEVLARNLQELLSNGQCPTAIIADSSEKAVVMLTLLLHEGYKVPGDMSLAALFDNRHFTALRPQITATSAMGVDVAERALDSLVSRIKNPAREPEHIYMSAEIISRGSVATARIAR